MIVAMTAIRAAFRLKGRLHSYQFRAKAEEHLFDNVVGANAEKFVFDFRGQMSVSQVPSQAHQLKMIFVPNLDDRFGCGLNSQPPPIFEL
jgi:hypothetical protein